ncbi:MAG: hypothetical protein L3J79_03750, partial [Candidatus Marinimicrobia bacterium]|nr:hypothetical protein [Candidatus Neomarinimicrobiota bacterium]
KWNLHFPYKEFLLDLLLGGPPFLGEFPLHMHIIAPCLASQAHYSHFFGFIHSNNIHIRLVHLCSNRNTSKSYQQVPCHNLKAVLSPYHPNADRLVVITIYILQ